MQRADHRHLFSALSLAVSLRYYTDPACSASWAAEPRLRRLMMEFGDELEITYVMGGLAREYEADLSSLVIAWLDDAASPGMPVDPRIWAGTAAALQLPGVHGVQGRRRAGAGGGGALPARAARGDHVPPAQARPHGGAGG